VYLKDPAVSQVHAIIKWTGSEYTVTDLGSSNGTLVNDEECETDEAVVLKNGDLIVVGTDTTVKVTIVEADAVAEKKEQPAPKQPRGAAAKKLEAAEAKKESVEKAKAAAKAKEEEALEKEKKKQQALETEKKPEHESVTVEKFLLNTVETMIAEVKDLAERACVDIGEETKRIKTKLRAETRAAS
jgi:pSer/pThr/pTyr-binding forkhead associated (FHA) protein